MKRDWIEKVGLVLGWCVIVYGVFGGHITFSSGGTVILGFLIVMQTYD